MHNTVFWQWGIIKLELIVNAKNKIKKFDFVYSQFQKINFEEVYIYWYSTWEIYGYIPKDYVIIIIIYWGLSDRKVGNMGIVALHEAKSFIANISYGPLSNTMIDFGARSNTWTPFFVAQISPKDYCTVIATYLSIKIVCILRNLRI